MPHEVDYTLSVSPGEGLSTMREGAAIDNRISEWLETPEGTVADRPAWGHNLSHFWFDPLGVDRDVSMELAIFDKITRDIRDIAIRAVQVSAEEIDLVTIKIVHNYGTYSNSSVRRSA